MKRRLLAISLFAFVLLLCELLSSCHTSEKAKAKAALKAADKKAAAEKDGTDYSTEGAKTYTVTGKGAKSKKHSTPNPEREGGIVSKYASLLGVSKKDIANTDLYNFIDLWYGTPYKFAGRSRSGVDCSDFASLLEQGIYDKTITGACWDIYKDCKPIKPSQLKEGDLVFFKINSKSLSHVGVYLQNNKFVHASVHAGVVISDLNEDYYKKYFWGAGSLK